MRNDLRAHQRVPGNGQALQQRDLQLAGIDLPDLHIGGIRALTGNREGPGENIFFCEGDSVDRSFNPVSLDRSFHRLHVFLRYRIHYNSSIFTLSW